MRVLGVDPGLTRCGLGVVDGVPGRAALVAVGVVRTPADAALGARLVALEEAVEGWLDLHRPEAVAVERVFAQANVRTVMGTAQAGAVAVVCAARRGLPVALHTPSEVKAAVTGSGRADKAQVALMVARLLRLDGPPRPADAADALALALCQLWRGPALARLAGAAAGATVIASVAGVVTALLPGGVVLRVGGVGLALQTTPGTRARLRVGDEAELATSLVVREDSLTLYGFGEPDERDLFELLQTSSGVGPRLAQAVLTVHEPDAVRRALQTEDLVALCLVPGIGRKGAQRMVLELKDKVGPAGTAPPPATPAGLGRHPHRGAGRPGLARGAGRGDHRTARAGAPGRGRRRRARRCCVRPWRC